MCYPFSLEILEQHLLGEITAGLYIRRHNDTVKVLVIDLDISKKYLLQAASDPAGMAKLMQQAHRVALRVQQVAADWGLNCYVEDSGYRGRHCWFFLDSPLKSTTALDFFKRLRFAAGICEPVITWEYFPAREKFKPGHLGELIKLPFGVHGKTGRRGLFLQEDGTPFLDQGSFLRSIKRCDAIRLAAIASGMEPPAEIEMKAADRKTIDANSASPGGNLGAKQSPQDKESKTSDVQRVEDRLRHLHPLVQGAPQLVRQVITRCELVRHLVFKSLETAYLSHRERFTLLCIFGHLGAGGKEYLHTVISRCMNYDQRTTERFIAKLPPKPVSCPRIREEYKELTAGLGCDCVFPQRKGCYPSPVLHALTGKDAAGSLEQKITVPKLRSETAEAGNKLQDEKERLQSINTVTRKLINLRQHQNGITKSIDFCKRQLLEYFLEKNVERLPMELGTLVLVRTGEEADFIIEL
ncbi:MAG: hypothetical protein DDT34_01724 [Firmicutes bacterium]|nr:hypothetical protein [Bacillota bacterium]